MNEWGSLIEPGDTLALVGVSGSRAYGTNNPDSDYDYRGIFMAGIDKFLGVNSPPEQYVRDKPDITIFEAKKFLQLAMQGNPNILEVLWLPDYQLIDEIYGTTLLGLKRAVLSESVERRYLGFADGQMHKIRNGRYGDMEDKRYKKAILHAFRLMFQLAHLKANGNIQVRMDEEEKETCFKMATLPPDKAINRFESVVAMVKGLKSVLPKKPDFKLVNETLISLRIGQVNV